MKDQMQKYVLSKWKTSKLTLPSNGKLAWWNCSSDFFIGLGTLMILFDKLVECYNIGILSIDFVNPTQF